MLVYSSKHLKADGSLVFLLYISPCRTVRAISSDRGKVVSGSDDQSVLVWDKQTTQLLEELKGHDAQVWLDHFVVLPLWFFFWGVCVCVCLGYVACFVDVL